MQRYVVVDYMLSVEKSTSLYDCDTCSVLVMFGKRQS